METPKILKVANGQPQTRGGRDDVVFNVNSIDDAIREYEKRILLRAGEQGPEVKWLQTLLTDRGFTLTVDGLFGKQTELAVKEFQSKHNLPADGIAGPQTMGLLAETK